MKECKTLGQGNAVLVGVNVPEHFNSPSRPM